MTAILGISAFYHDSAAALVVDGEVIAAAQEERFTRKKHDFNFPNRAIEFCLGQAGLTPADVTGIVHGTTLATNAVIERQGARTALITTEGFRDVIEMGREDRYAQYDLNLQKPAPLVPRRLRFPVPERIAADGAVLVPLDRAALTAVAGRLRDAGAESAAPSRSR